MIKVRETANFLLFQLRDFIGGEQMIFENNIIYGGQYPEPECWSLGDLVVKHLKRRENEVILVIGILFKITNLKNFHIRSYSDQWSDWKQMARW